MAWTNEDGIHDGWDAAEFAGDRFSVGAGGGGVTVWRFAPGPGPLRETGERETEVDGRTAIGWRALCQCGWRGELWQKVATPGEHDPAHHRVYDPDPCSWGSAPTGLEEAMHREWRGHLEPETLTAVRIEARALADAHARLDDAVRAAREDGRSWADIGAAVGISRQSAHERWAQPSRPAQRRYAHLATPNAPDWASGDDFTAVAELLATHGYARQPDTGDGVVRWASTRTDLPEVRVWIGPYWPSPGSVHGTGEPIIQINDAHDNNGQGKDAAIGKLASKTARDILATCLADREKEWFYDPTYYDDDGL
ncbi:AsnC family protein [Streptosporangium canum]|uniref:AsnC family protein n=1 Tax=Streptosporangium canum TaxID=324952 RepID=UPI0036A61CA7